MPDHRHRRWMAYVRVGGWAYPALSYSRDLRDWSPPEPAKHITPATVQAPAVECMIPFTAEAVRKATVTCSGVDYLDSR